MKSKDLVAGVEYCYVERLRPSGSYRSSHLGDDDYWNKRGTLISVQGSVATLVMPEGGTEVEVMSRNILGTWEEHLAAREAKEAATRAQHEAQDAEVKARNEARAWLRETLGKDWAEGLPYGIDTKASVYDDRSGVRGGDFGSRFDKVSTVDLKKFVEKAYQAGYEQGHADRFVAFGSED